MSIEQGPRDVSGGVSSELERFKKLLNKDVSERVAANCYLALFAATLTASFYAPSDEAQLILVLMAAIILVFVMLVYWGKD